MIGMDLSYSLSKREKPAGAAERPVEALVLAKHKVAPTRSWTTPESMSLVVVLLHYSIQRVNNR